MGKNIGKTIVMFLMVIILILFGIMWFDYLGVIQAKKIFSPLYSLLGFDVQTSESIKRADGQQMADLDADRLEKRLEALVLKEEELNLREIEIEKKELEIQKSLQELDEQKKVQEEREKTFNNRVKKYDDREVNIVQTAKNLTGMVPAKAVDILLAMEDQDVIDVLRKVEEIARENNTSSMVSYWLSLMPAERVAEINRKMTNKPLSLD